MNKVFTQYILGLQLHSSAPVQRAHWLVSLRWIAIISQFAFLAIANNLRIIDSSIYALANLIVIFMTLFNALLSYALVQFPKSISHTHTLQISVDLIETTMLLFLCGGFSNPFYLILIVNVMIAPVIVSKWQSFIVLLCMIMGLVTLYFSPFAFSLQELGVDRKDIDILALALTALSSWQVTSWLKSKETKLQNNLERLQKRSYRHDRLKALGALTAGLCHELGTPLNTMKMRVDRLLRANSENKDAIAISKAVSQCEKSISSINDRNYDLENTSLLKTNMNELLIEVSNELSRDHGNVKFDIKAVTELEVLLPKHAFTRTLIDLLENSIEANAKLIEINIKNNILTIIDNGDGFPESVLQNLGEPFLTTKERGSGQGLYNALTLAEYIGADFNIKNGASGAIVTFEFLNEVME